LQRFQEEIEEEIEGGEEIEGEGEGEEEEGEGEEEEGVGVCSNWSKRKLESGKLRVPTAVAAAIRGSNCSQVLFFAIL